LVRLGTANAEEGWWNQVYNKTYYYQPWDGSWLVDCYLGGNIAC
jgi:hypothetical protein